MCDSRLLPPCSTLSKVQSRESVDDNLVISIHLSSVLMRCEVQGSSMKTRKSSLRLTV